MNKKMQVRLALRVEGEWWNAYLAAADTMDGARKIGSILIGSVRGNKDRKSAFMELMQGMVADAVKQVTGSEPAWWDAQAAPEHERSGTA